MTSCLTRPWSQLTIIPTVKHWIKKTKERERKTLLSPFAIMVSPSNPYAH